MPIRHQDETRVVSWHGGGRRTLVTVALRLFLVLSLVGVPLVLAVAERDRPAELTFQCDRTAGHCLYTHHRTGRQERCPVQQVKGFSVLAQDRGESVLVWNGSDRWSGQVSGPEVERLTAGVAALHAFADSGADRLEVRLPNGQTDLSPWFAPLAVAMAVWQLLLVSRAQRRDEVELDTAAGTITVRRRRYLFPTRTEAVPTAVVREVVLRRRVADRLRPAIQYTLVGVTTDAPEPVVLVSGYWAPGAEEDAVELAAQLSRRLNLPSRDG